MSRLDRRRLDEAADVLSDLETEEHLELDERTRDEVRDVRKLLERLADERTGR